MMKIEKYGDGYRIDFVMRRLLSLDERGLLPRSLSHVILLPIPSSRDKKRVTGTDISLFDAVRGASVGCLICGYGIPEDVRLFAEARGAVVFDALSCEDFMRENSEISAIGALGYILTEIKRVPSDSCFGIVGYGRIGRELMRMLMFLRARVKIYTSRLLTRIELGECGVETVYTDYSEPLPLSGIDVLVNTAPTELSHSFPDGKIPAGLVVIELASGENFRSVSGVVRLPGIPDKMYPESAGSAYLRAIEKFISEVFVE